jgi:preprotein translocase subunit YajC
MSLLDLFISPAAAQAAPGATPSPFPSIVMMIALFGIMYFLMIRPQMKRAKEHKDLISKLAVGDEVITTSGIAGRVRELGENFITVEIADGVQVKMQRAAITAVLPRDTLKSA